MTGLKGILSGISLAIIAFISIRVGLVGLRTNLKGSELIKISWRDFIKDPEYYKDKYINIDSVLTINNVLQIRNDAKSIYYITAIAEDLNDSFVRFQDTPKYFTKTNGISEFKHEKNLKGIVRDLRTDLSSEELRVLESANDIVRDAILINTLEKPRKWFWNTLLIVIPLIFMFMFAKAIYNKFKSSIIKK